ncbi:hypothetical protein SCUP515_10147 [Seiridium cupressi]
MANRPGNLGKIIINGKECGPTPHEVNPELPESMVCTQWPPNEQFMEDPDWYDATGQDMTAQIRTWATQSESGQIDAFKELLHEFAHHRLDIMHAAAAEPVAEERDYMPLGPLHVAAARGPRDCVNIFIEKAGLEPNILDHQEGTALMGACFGRRIEIVQYLFGKGGDVTSRQWLVPQGDDGTNVFEVAVGGGSVERAKQLLNTHENSLFMAAAGGHDHIVEYMFIEHPGQPDTHMTGGKFANVPTPLWTAGRRARDHRRGYG